MVPYPKRLVIKFSFLVLSSAQRSASKSVLSYFYFYAVTKQKSEKLMLSLVDEETEAGRGGDATYSEETARVRQAFARTQTAGPS